MTNEKVYKININSLIFFGNKGIGCLQKNEPSFKLYPVGHPLKMA